jgi:hypothetical protein
MCESERCAPEESVKPQKGNADIVNQAKRLFEWEGTAGTKSPGAQEESTEASMICTLVRAADLYLSAAHQGGVCAHSIKVPTARSANRITVVLERGNEVKNS